jgi:hypothetical protein
MTLMNLISRVRLLFTTQKTISILNRDLDAACSRILALERALSVLLAPAPAPVPPAIAVPAITLDQWLSVGESHASFYTSKYHKVPGCYVRREHNGNHVTSEVMEDRSPSKALELAILQIETTIGTAWRGAIPAEIGMVEQ